MAWGTFDINNATSDSKSYAFAGYPKNGFFIKPDGSKIYVFDYSQTLMQYSLSTAWDISTASSDSKSFNFNSQVGSYIGGIEFKTDGTKCYVTNQRGAVYQYSLSTAWDISTASYDSKTYTLAATGAGKSTNIFFKSDGTRLYVFNPSDSKVQSYTLSTSWDISTASSDSKSYTITSSWSGALDDDGDKLYANYYSMSGYIRQYSLSTDYDVSTASYDNKALTTAYQTSIFFKRDDGSKLYYNSGGTIYQYTTYTPSSGNIKKLNNIAWANVKKINNIAVTNIKKINNITAQ